MYMVYQNFLSSVHTQWVLCALLSQHNFPPEMDCVPQFKQDSHATVGDYAQIHTSINQG
jgi:hypothetical protein